MTYQVLARKWRPRDFPSLVGQDHVVRALTHALDQQRLHHAYLFTGTRGVGKTTLSRILAKALNCETGITSQPCGVCRACREIDAGRFVDYVEMDAASNRGVDEMAALLERAIYAPVDARFKVYMIDEVHMLTNHAFNAMLKTLEEPPAHVKFILATTDPQKIPVTVLSRCLQFNLKQMPAGEIVGHLDKVLRAEGIDFEPQALRLLSRAADGSMRDALSLTDQAIAYAAGAVNEEAVRGMLGAIDQHYLMRLLDGIVAGDGAAVLAVADEMTSRSLSFSMALQDLAQLLNRIGWAQFAPASVLDEWPEADEIRRFAHTLSPEQVQLYYQIATIGRSELGLAPDEYAGFTMTLLRMLAFRPLTGASPPGGSGARTSFVPDAQLAAPMPAARPTASAAGGSTSAAPVSAVSTPFVSTSRAPVSSAAPTPVAPASVAPTPTAPASVAPTPTAPASVAPTSVAPASVAPTSVVPASVAPTPTAPASTASTPAAPASTAPTPTAPALVTPVPPPAPTPAPMPAPTSAVSAAVSRSPAGTPAAPSSGDAAGQWSDREAVPRVPPNGDLRRGGNAPVERRAVPAQGTGHQDDDAALLAAFGDAFDDPFGDAVITPVANMRIPASTSRAATSATPDAPFAPDASTPAAGDASPQQGRPAGHAAPDADAMPPEARPERSGRAVDPASPARGSSPARAALEALGALRGGAGAKTAMSRAPAAGGVRTRAAAPGPASAVLAPGPTARGVPPVEASRQRASADTASAAVPGTARAADDMPTWDTAPWEDDGAAAFLSSARPLSDASSAGESGADAARAVRSGFGATGAPGAGGAGAPGPGAAYTPATTRGAAACVARDAGAGFAASPPAPPPMPDAVSLDGVGFDQDWPALAARLDVKGLAQQLAFQSELVALDGACLSLRIPMAQLASGPHVEKVVAALIETLGRTVELRVEVGRAERTAAAVDAARRAERQWRAERSIHGDPFVQALLREFDAAILPGSIQPLAAPGTAVGAPPGAAANFSATPKSHTESRSR